LGTKVVEKYYHSYLNDENIFEIVRKDNQIVGVNLVVKPYNNIRENFIRSNKPLLIYSIVKGLITFKRPVWSKVFNLFKSVLVFSSDASENADNCKPYFILSIFVSEMFRGQGVAEMLLESCERQLKIMDEQEYKLTVRKENLSAIRFYDKMLFKIDRDKGKEIVMKKEL